MLTWLADVLRAEGLGVIGLPGWETRQTRTGFNPVGVVCHHTASPKTAADDSIRRLLRDGRSDLKGPLCQLGLERDGTYVVIAAGRGNHNGFGTWGNDSIGIEAYNNGVGEPWPTPQLDAYHRGVAAICRHQGWTIAQVRGHKETDPGRKIDPAGIDMNNFRAAVAVLLKSTPAPPPPPQEDDMPKATYIRIKSDPRVYLAGVGMDPRPVRLFKDAEYHAAREGVVILNPPTDADEDVADGSGTVRKVMVVDDGSLFGI